VIYLDVEDLLHIAERMLPTVEVHDLGLLEAAAARPHASAYGRHAYRSIHAKAAAILHSLARNHPLVDGNKRLALAATLAFYGLNGLLPTMTNEQAYELIIAVAVAVDELDEVADIAQLLRGSTKKRIRH
jgi:death-on-curing protein